MLIHLKSAKKCRTDAMLVMKWRNNPETLRMFYHSQPKAWPSFYREYCDTYFKNSRLLPAFAVYKNKKIGFLRFNKYKDPAFGTKVADIDINVNPEKRGMGLGREIIKKGAEYLFTKGYKLIVAEIKKINLPSIKAFKNAGFVYFDSIDKPITDIGDIISIHRLILRKNDK